jgi:two-component system chemotaxis response regulator CheB
MSKRADFSRMEAVAIGASAGGVKALCDFFRLLTPTSKMAIFVVLHTGKQSYLDEVLSRCDSHPISFGRDGEKIIPGRVYLARPGHHLLVDATCIRLSDTPPLRWWRPSIDLMFASVAGSFKRRAIGIVMTGLLNDGAMGVRRIKEEGGTVFVQDPSEAEQPSMPQNALAATEVDHCLPIAEIAANLNLRS